MGDLERADGCSSPCQDPQVQVQTKCKSQQCCDSTVMASHERPGHPTLHPSNQHAVLFYTACESCCSSTVLPGAYLRRSCRVAQHCEKAILPGRSHSTQE